MTQSLAVIDKHPIAFVSAVPSVQSTIQNLEQIRRFVTNCFNVDLKARIATLPKKPDGSLVKDLDQKERKRLEVDWGTIPGVDKPFLMQPGAEKFLLWLNLRPKFYTKEHELPDGHMEVVCHVVLHSKKTGEEVFEGPDCSCSTMESNYRFRWADADAKPSDAIVAKMKQAGTGRNYKKAVWVKGHHTGDEWVWQERIENPNIYDERNKVRQISQKRGLVKGVKNMGAMSELFNADPDEWNIPDEPTEDPRNEMDYTESGRRIVGQDGRTPSGKQTTWEGSKQAALDVATKKLAAHAAGYDINTDLDDLGNLLPCAVPKEQKKQDAREMSNPQPAVNSEPQHVTAKVEEQSAKAAASVKDKVAEYYLSRLGDIEMVVFVDSPAVAALMDEGLKDMTLFAANTLKARYFADDPENMRQLEAMATKVGFAIRRVPAPSHPPSQTTAAPVKQAAVPQSARPAAAQTATRGPMAAPLAAKPPEDNFVGAKEQREAVSDRTASQAQSTNANGPQTHPDPLADGAGRLSGILESFEMRTTKPPVHKETGKPTGKPGGAYLSMKIDGHPCSLFDNKEMPLPNGSKKALFHLIPEAKGMFVCFEAVRKDKYINLSHAIQLGDMEWEWEGGKPESIRRMNRMY